MSLGQSQTILICSPGLPELSPCPSGTGPTTVTAYVLSPAASQYIDAISTPFSLATGLELWGVAMSVVIFCWFISHMLKQVIKAVY